VQCDEHLRRTNHADDAYLVGGEDAFLENRYDEALRLFEALEKSQDPHYRSYSFPLKLVYLLNWANIAMLYGP